MHVAYVMNGLPWPGNNGAPLLTWTLIEFLLRQGHRVSYFSLKEPWDTFCTPERTARVRRLGIRVVTLPLPPSSPRPSSYPDSSLGRPARYLRRWIARPTPGALYPTASLAPWLKKALVEDPPDAVLAFHTEALAATYTLRVAPRLGIMGDPTHMPAYYQWRRARTAMDPRHIAGMLLTFREWYYHAKYNCLFLKDCESRGAVAAHYAGWFRRRGVRGCRYYRIPVREPEPSRSGPSTLDGAKGSRPRILLVGALGSTSTRSGLDLFARDVLPRLKRSLGREGFRVDIVGSGEWPTEVPRVDGEPSVRLRGYVEDIDPEFHRATVFLVPTPIKLGIRVRVLTAFSHGCCIVAHEANRAGIPELRHGENALLARHGEGLASAVLRAARDADLRARLREGARRTYERYFTPEAAAAPIAAELESLAGRRRPWRAPRPG